MIQDEHQPPAGVQMSRLDTVPHTSGTSVGASPSILFNFLHPDEKKLGVGKDELEKELKLTSRQFA